MDIDNLKRHTTEKLRNATPLATFDDFADAQALAGKHPPACITGSIEGYTVWRLDGAPTRRWDVLLDVVRSIIGSAELSPAVQAMVDQQQASLAAALERYGLTVDEDVAFVMLVTNVIAVGQVLAALTQGLITFPIAQQLIAVTRGNLAALVAWAPAETAR